MLYNDDNVMEPTKPSVLPDKDEKRKRATTINEGKKWAGDVNEENAWDRLVLTLDGGGIRGYSSLIILERLMTRVAAWEKIINDRDIKVEDLLPCHYFDYIWGTSTGGLIAIMLGRLRMSVSQALAVYRDVGNSIFGHHQKRTLGGINFAATKYNHDNVENTVKLIAGKHCKEHQSESCGGNDTLLWKDMTKEGVNNNWDLCQTVCITARASGKHSQALPLRSYSYVHDPSLNNRDPNFGVQDLDLLIWEAARATSAAPFYFKIYTKWDAKNGKLRRYKDGGTLLNNPAEKALNEVRDRYGQVNNQRRDPALLLSVGTGIRSDMPFAAMSDGSYAAQKKADRSFMQSVKERLAVAKHMLMRYTEGESVHRMIRENIAAEHLWYKRLNVDVGLGTMDLADWRKGDWHDPDTGETIQHSGGATLTDIEDATRRYLTRDDLHTADEIEWFLLPREQIDFCAERMVRHRAERLRLARDQQGDREWETHQGRYVSGQKAEPWDVDSYDRPFERSSKELV